MLLGGLLLTVATLTVAQRRGQEVRERRLAHRVQHGQCSYTFLLPEPEACAPETGGTFRGSNSLQRDSLNLVAWPTKRMQHLEKMLENNTQRLQKVRAGSEGAGGGGPGAAIGSWSIHPRGLPWAQRARLMGPLSLNCRD